jgi:tetratricopeptide (TPR) repeat protein
MRLPALFASTAAFCLLGFGVQAASLVLGGGDAEACYRAAKRGAADRISLTVCGRALENDPLSPQDRASTYINRGVILVSRKAYAEAIADFDHALHLQPKSGEALLNRGAARLGLSQWREAIADLDRGIELGASEPEKGWFDKGIAHEALGDLKSAYADYNKAAEINPAWALPREELKRFHVESR